MKTKTKFSIISLFAAASLSLCPWLAAVVDVYDEFGELIAETEDLNSALSYINDGAFERMVVLSSDTIISEELAVKSGVTLTFCSSEEGVMREISGGDDFRILSFHATIPSFTCENVKFTHGYVSTSLRDGGGAIRLVNSGIVKLGNSVFESNYAESTGMGVGGAVYGDVEILEGVSAQFNSNSVKSTGNASAYGGAIYGAVTIKSGAIVSFRENTVESPLSASGGAVYGNVTIEANSSVVFLENSVTGGESASGGAVLGKVWVKDSARVNFTGNTVHAESESARVYGGAVQSLTDSLISSECTVEFSKNIASAKASASGSSFADAEGGAVNISSGDFSIGAVGALTFSENEANATAYSKNYSATANAYGGAVNVMYGQISVKSGAGKVLFSGNLANASSDTHYGSITKAYAYGGAIYGKTISFSGEDVEFTNNRATATAKYSTKGGYGGAIYVLEALTFESGLTKIVFDENTAMTEGGAIYLEEDSSASFSDTFSGTATFYANAAVNGGAIYSKGTLSFTENTGTIEFNGNQASGNGGAIYADSGAFTLAGNVNFKNNEASAQGGAIYIASTILLGKGDTTNVVFSGNKVGSDSAGWTNNDIYMTNANGKVVLQDAGSYTFGGGINGSKGGALAIGLDADGNVAGGTQVTFKAGAVNEISGAVSIAGAGTVVRFENTGNTFTGGLTVSDGASIEVVLTEAAKSTAIFNLGGDSLTIDDDLKITIADIVVGGDSAVSLAAETAYNYQLFDGVAGLNESYFVLNEELKAFWKIAGYQNGILLLETIPEPSAFGLLAGLSALALVVVRRRRK